MTAERTVQHVTCLGCGCSCDDLTVTVSDERIVAATPICPIGRAWLGDGRLPSGVLIEGQAMPLEAAIRKAAAALAAGRHRLVHLGPDITSEAQRAGLAVADLLGAAVDTSTSETAAQGLVSAQRRGRTTATLGEVRNRGTVFLFWGTDPSEKYPRFLARYGIEAIGSHVPQGRKGRDVISVSIGKDRGISDADLAFQLSPDQEIAALSLMRAAVLGIQVPAASPVAKLAVEVTARLKAARYAVIVHDAEPTAEQRNPLRTEALLGLAEALNGPTRAALCSLRAGGNRVGAEAVLTSQTGYPLAVDYSRGYPRYISTGRGIGLLRDGAFQTALLVGSPSFDQPTGRALAAATTVLVGPRATQAGFRATVAIDTGMAGVHEGGTAYRMDEVPLRLRPPLESPLLTVQVLRSLVDAIRAELRRSPA
jgi:formylmethanofuran dehydrogenase subunit B